MQKEEERDHQFNVLNHSKTTIFKEKHNQLTDFVLGSFYFIFFES